MRAHAWNAFMALVFSVLIWCAVGSHLTTTGQVSIPFEVVVPKDVIVRHNDQPSQQRLLLDEKVTITVRGPKERIDRLGQAGLRARAVYSFDRIRAPLKRGRDTLDPKEHVVNLPAGLEVVKAEPREIVLTFSQVVERSVFIQPGKLKGKPAPGFRVGKIKLSVTQVTVRGDAAALDRDPGTSERPYFTEPIDIGDSRRATYKAERAILCPPGVLPKEKVEVTVEILPDLVTREIEFTVHLLTTAPDRRKEAIKPLPLQIVPDSPGGWKRKLKLRGPKETLEKLALRLRQSMGLELDTLPMAYILAGDVIVGDQPGQANGTIHIAGLPEGIEFSDTNKRFPVKLEPK